MSDAIWNEALDGEPPRGGDVCDGGGCGIPRDNQNNIIYCNIEGVTFLSSSRIAVVSDASDTAGCQAKDQSIHIFDIIP